MALQEVLVRLRAVGQRAFQRDMDASARSVEGVGTASVNTARQSAKSFAKWAAASGAVAAGTKVMKDSVTNAVDLGEEISKTGVVFRGPASRAVLEWSKTTTEGFGISRQEALASANSLGNMLVPLGLARGEAAGMSKRMVELAGDMASLNNESPETMLAGIRSGLAGESEPLKRFGVTLTDARLKQEAMNLGLYKGKGNLDAAAKAQAAYSLMIKDTKDAHGDAARTGDTLAGRQRELLAQYKDTTAVLGTQLLPILTFLVNNLGLVATAVGALTTLWVAYRLAVLVATVAQIGLNTALLAVALPIVAVVALAAAFVVAYKKVKWFREAVDATVSAVAAAFRRMKDVVSSVVSSIANRFRELIAFFRRLPEALGNVGGTIGNAVQGFIPGQHGALMPSGGGTALVGEAGPELLSLPGGARVIPPPSLGGVGGPIHTHVYLHGREIATAVAQDTADRRARR
jgi:hypothetical protein